MVEIPLDGLEISTTEFTCLIEVPGEGIPDAWIQCEKIEGVWLTKEIYVSLKLRRQGIGTALVKRATELLGVYPAPELIAAARDAKGFWRNHGKSK
jgi:GNAT superfamily N-acetyltransferase